MGREWELRMHGQHVVMKDAVVPVLIGRSFDQPMLAVAPESNAFVSRHHVEIQARDGELWCMDLGSANGTWIQRGDESIPTSAHQQFRLEAGDVLMTIDKTVLCTIHPAEGAPTATIDAESQETPAPPAAVTRTLQSVEEAAPPEETAARAANGTVPPAPKARRPAKPI